MPNRGTISRDELVKLPYLDHSVWDDRLVPILPYLNENGEWEHWWPVRDGLVNIKGTPIESDYFAKCPERDTDIYFWFVDFITKRAYFPDVVFFIDCIRNDLHNLGASLGKIDLFFRVRKETGSKVRRYVSTETEYIFTVCRSLYDLLQEVISRLWNRVQLLDKNVKKQKLPQSFRKMVLEDNKLMDPGRIQERYRLTKELADFYSQAGPFFRTLKDFRDGIVHHGKWFELIFVTDRGFAIPQDTQPFSSFGVWRDQDLLPNDLASFRPVLAHIVTSTLNACELFTRTMQGTIQFPPDIAPDHNLYIRGPHNGALIKMKTILEGNPWWG